MEPLSDERLVADLTKHPGWAAWIEQEARDVEKEVLALARLLLKTREPIDPLEIEYQRGYIQGRLKAVRRPESAARKQEKE